MIVEDHEATTYLIKRAFADRGDKVDWDLCFAKDGEEALDCLFRKGPHANAARPDLLLLDWNLPKVSGKEVLRLLKSDVSLRTIPVLVFSASRDDDDIHAAYVGYANGYVPKPADMDGLNAVIDSIESFWVHTAHLPPKQPGAGCGEPELNDPD
jgi:CheY-like chemotaxis protein